ncbi:MAG: embC, partial [Aeromicrobium sp.]|nr:embC [Aeromicrobium sp.]
VRSDRTRIWPMLTAVMASVALLLVLVFADSDLRVWLANKTAFGNDGVHASGWRAELERYRLLLFGVYDTVVRRASVLLGLTVVALFLVGFDRRRSLLSILPSAALTISFALLAVSPSKWPWHFGTLGLIAAAALTMEIHELASSSRRLTISHGVLVVGFVMVGSVAWRSSESWGVFALVGGVKGFARLGHYLSNPLVPLVIVTAILLALMMRRRDRRAELHRLIRALPLLVLVPMVVSTVVRFTVESGDGSYSLAGQNLRALVGRGGCGAAPLLKVDLPQASVPAEAASDLSSAANDFHNDEVDQLSNTAEAFYDDGQRPAWAANATGTYVNGNDDIGWAASSWQEVPEGSFGLFAGVAGRVGGGNEFILQRGLRKSGEVRITDSFNLTMNHDSEFWARVVLGRWDSAPNTLARIVLVDHSTGFGGWVAVSSITVVPTKSLQQLSDEGVRVMVSPFYRTFMPCIVEPDEPGGIAAEPDLVIGDIPVSPTSPGYLIQDVYGRTRLPVTLDGGQALNADSYEPGLTWTTVNWRSFRD